MAKAKAKMINVLLSDLASDLRAFEDPYGLFWSDVLARLRGLVSVNQWPDNFKTPEELVEEIKPYFADNGIYEIISAKDRHVSLQLGKAQGGHVLVTQAVAAQVKVMIPDYCWAVHIIEKV